MAAHARLKNEFTEDEKYYNFMTWLKLQVFGTSLSSYLSLGECVTWIWALSRENLSSGFATR